MGWRSLMTYTPILKVLGSGATVDRNPGNFDLVQLVQDIYIGILFCTGIPASAPSKKANHNFIRVSFYLYELYTYSSFYLHLWYSCFFTARMPPSRFHPYRRTTGRPHSARRLFRPRASFRLGNRPTYKRKRGRVVRRRRGGLRRRRVRARVRVRGRGKRRHGGGMYGYAQGSKFQKALSAANGRRMNLSRFAQCEFQVPLTEIAGLASTTSGGGAAQYVFPRDPADPNGEAGFMYYPFDPTDCMGICNAFWTAGSTGLNDFQRWLDITSKATYTIRNQNSFPTRYEILRFTTKKDIVYAGVPNAVERSYRNIFNVAGSWIHRTGQGAGAGAADATHQSLHMINSKVEGVPPIKYFFSCKKKTIRLEPGEQRDFVITGRQVWTKYEVLGVEREGQTITSPAKDHYRGNRFLCFKMLSEPADYNGAGETTALTALSTRSTPVCLLSYQVHYNVLAPQYLPTAQYVDIGTTGVVLAPVAANIQNMSDDDWKTKVESNAK